MMSNLYKYIKFPTALVLATVVGSLVPETPVFAQGAQLEEIVVTAQRREQSLQEVPISIETYTGGDIKMQGYRNLDDMAKFTPSVVISNGVQEQNVAIRSFSTRGNSLTLESAAPVFLDGVYFGRMSMVKTAFLDVGSVEVLKGPQPLYFGMNATAGAFNIQSQRPGDEWEGDVSAEFGNNAQQEFTGAFGGPLTDTVGLRVAGTYETNDGVVYNRYNPGEKLPKFNHLGGRVALEWKPTEQLTIFGKVDGSRQRNGSEITMGCLTGAPISGFGNTPTLGETESLEGQFGNERSVFAPAPNGIGDFTGIIQPEVTAPGDCFKGNLAFSRGGPYRAPPANVNSSQNSDRLQDGSVDGRGVFQAFYTTEGGEFGVGGKDMGGTDGKDNINAWNSLLDVKYDLDNGITATSQTGFVKLDRQAARDFVLSPFLLGHQPKFEDYSQWSQMVQLDSPAEGYDMNWDVPGGVNIGFMTQAFLQLGYLDAQNGNGESGSIRRPMRFNTVWEDSRWASGSWNLTFNLMDKQLSLQVGGRYTDVKKDVHVAGWGATFIFDEVPCNSAGTDSNPATCTPDPDFKRVNPALTTFTVCDPITAKGGPLLNTCGTTGALDSRFTLARQVRIDSPQLLLPGARTNNLWAPSFWNYRSGGATGVPLNYRGGKVPAVGLTAPVYANQDGPWDATQKADNYSDQFVLSYTPNALNGDHTFYGKYVESFKGPVTDTAQGTLPATFDELTFSPEYVVGWEVGAKGMLFDSRLRYDITAFRNTFSDLQTIGAAPANNAAGQISVSLNAGEQQVDGIEFALQAAATENLTLNVAATFLDGIFNTFEGDGCSVNSQVAAAIDATTPVASGGSRENRTAAEITAANTILANVAANRRAGLPTRAELPEEFFYAGGCRLVAGPGTDGLIYGATTISRTGVKPPDTPSWKFSLGANYSHPFMDSYNWFVDVRGFISDGSRSGRSNDPATTVFFDTHGDMNVSAGFGPQDEKWRVVGFVRNILEDRETYHPEFDIIDLGLVTTTMGPSSFRSYGARLEYNF